MKKRRLILKPVSWFVIFTFTFTTIAWSAPSQFKTTDPADAKALAGRHRLPNRDEEIYQAMADKYEDELKPQTKDVETRPDASLLTSKTPIAWKIKIPPEYGEVKARWVAQGSRLKAQSKEPTVVILQDAHCNFEAQMNISKIIRHLSDNFGVEKKNHNTPLAPLDRGEIRDSVLPLNGDLLGTEFPPNKGGNKTMGGVIMVGLEGAFGELDTTTFSSYPHNIRDIVARYFVREGKISGAEYAAITDEEEIPFYGIEEGDLYLDNYEAFLSIVKYRGPLTEEVESIEEVLSQLRSLLYSQELQEFEEQYFAFREEKITFFEYADHLLEEAKSLSIDLFEYPNLSLFREVKEREGRVSFDELPQEINAYLNALYGALTKEDLELSRLERFTRQYNQGKLSRYEYLTYIIEQGFKHNVNLLSFANLYEYSQYIKKYNRINKHELRFERRRLEQRIKVALVNSTDQKSEFRNQKSEDKSQNINKESLTSDVRPLTSGRSQETVLQLLELSERLHFVRSLINIKLFNQDLETFENEKESFRAKEYIDYIRKTAPQYGIPFNLSLDIAYLDRIIPKVYDFYSCSRRRDVVMVENLLKNVTPSALTGTSLDREDGQEFPPNKGGDKIMGGVMGNSPLALLVAGGFHTQGIREELEERGISYVVVSPRITHRQERLEELYMSRMLGEISDLDLLVMDLLDIPDINRFKVSDMPVKNSFFAESFLHNLAVMSLLAKGFTDDKLQAEVSKEGFNFLCSIITSFLSEDAEDISVSEARELLREKFGVEIESLRADAPSANEIVMLSDLNDKQYCDFLVNKLLEPNFKRNNQIVIQAFDENNNASLWRISRTKKDAESSISEGRQYAAQMSQLGYLEDFLNFDAYDTEDINQVYDVYSKIRGNVLNVVNNVTTNVIDKLIMLKGSNSITIDGITYIKDNTFNDFAKADLVDNVIRVNVNVMKQLFNSSLSDKEREFAIQLILGHEIAELFAAAHDVVDTHHVALVVEMEDIYTQSDLTDEEKDNVFNFIDSMAQSVLVRSENVGLLVANDILTAISQGRDSREAIKELLKELNDRFKGGLTYSYGHVLTSVLVKLNNMALAEKDENVRAALFQASSEILNELTLKSTITGAISIKLTISEIVRIFNNIEKVKNEITPPVEFVVANNNFFNKIRFSIVDVFNQYATDSPADQKLIADFNISLNKQQTLLVSNETYLRFILSEMCILDRMLALGLLDLQGAISVMEQSFAKDGRLMNIAGENFSVVEEEKNIQRHRMSQNISNFPQQYVSAFAQFLNLLSAQSERINVTGESVQDIIVSFLSELLGQTPSAIRDKLDSAGILQEIRAHKAPRNILLRLLVFIESNNENVSVLGARQPEVQIVDADNREMADAVYESPGLEIIGDILPKISFIEEYSGQYNIGLTHLFGSEVGHHFTRFLHYGPINELFDRINMKGLTSELINNESYVNEFKKLYREYFHLYDIIKNPQIDLTGGFGPKVADKLDEIEAKMRKRYGNNANNYFIKLVTISEFLQLDRQELITTGQIHRTLNDIENLEADIKRITPRKVYDFYSFRGGFLSAAMESKVSHQEFTSPANVFLDVEGINLSSHIGAEMLEQVIRQHLAVLINEGNISAETDIKVKEAYYYIAIWIMKEYGFNKNTLGRDVKSLELKNIIDGVLSVTLEDIKKVKDIVENDRPQTLNDLYLKIVTGHEEYISQLENYLKGSSSEDTSNAARILMHVNSIISGDASILVNRLFTEEWNVLDIKVKDALIEALYETVNKPFSIRLDLMTHDEILDNIASFLSTNDNFNQREEILNVLNDKVLKGRLNDYIKSIKKEKDIKEEKERKEGERDLGDQRMIAETRQEKSKVESQSREVLSEKEEKERRIKEIQDLVSRVSLLEASIKILKEKQESVTQDDIQKINNMVMDLERYKRELNVLVANTDAILQVDFMRNLTDEEALARLSRVLSQLDRKLNKKEFEIFTAFFAERPEKFLTDLIRSLAQLDKDTSEEINLANRSLSLQLIRETFFDLSLEGKQTIFEEILPEINKQIESTINKRDIPEAMREMVFSEYTSTIEHIKKGGNNLRFSEIKGEDGKKEKPGLKIAEELSGKEAVEQISSPKEAEGEAAVVSLLGDFLSGKISEGITDHFAAFNEKLEGFINTLQQVESHLQMRHYDGLMKSGRIKGRAAGASV